MSDSVGPVRFLVGAFGTRGDVQPMAALCQALQARARAVGAALLTQL